MVEYIWYSQQFTLLFICSICKLYNRYKYNSIHESVAKVHPKIDNINQFRFNFSYLVEALQLGNTIERLLVKRVWKLCIENNNATLEGQTANSTKSVIFFSPGRTSIWPGTQISMKASRSYALKLIRFGSQTWCSWIRKFSTKFDQGLDHYCLLSALFALCHNLITCQQVSYITSPKGSNKPKPMFLFIAN